MNSLMVFIPPIFATLAAQATAGATGVSIEGVIGQVLNLGVGGVMAFVAFWLYRQEVIKREAAEARERALLLEIVRERSGLKIAEKLESPPNAA